MFLANQESRLSTQRLYKLFGYREHRNLKETIANHIESFERFGTVLLVSSGTTSKGGRPAEAYALNLPQALLLAGLVKNSNNSKKAEVLTALVSAYEKSSLLSVLELVSGIDVEEVKEDRFVYVAKESVSGRYKIGISKDPEARLKSLNVGNPEKLELVHAYLATESGYQSEVLAHALFEKDRLNGEWFNGSIDLSALPSYEARCRAGDATGTCGCKLCQEVSNAHDIIGHYSKPMPRDFFIVRLVEAGFDYEGATSSVDALEDLGVISFDKSHVHDLQIENKAP